MNKNNHDFSLLHNTINPYYLWIHVFNFAYSLRFICDLKFNFGGTFMVISRHAQIGKQWLHSQLRRNRKHFPKGGYECGLVRATFFMLLTDDFTVENGP
jgi:hypothetical protein